MKPARLFVVLSVFLLATFFGVKSVFADTTNTAGGTLGGIGGGGGPWFRPDSVQQANSILSPTINYSQTNELVVSSTANTITANLIGYPSNNKVLKTGAAQFFMDNIAFMVGTPVISGTDYIAYTWNRLKVPGVTPTYAADPGGIGGVGYRSLYPVLQIWTLSRNVAYMFFAIAFVIAGMMIIMGRKLDARTTLTIQMALPRIFVAILLVTFSYAIAGFVIDLMYVVITVAFAALKPLLGPDTDLGGYQNLYDSVRNGETVFQFFLRSNWLDAAGGLAQATGALGEQIFGSIGGGAGQVVGRILGTGAGVLGSLVLAVAIFYSLFKIWLKLIMTYIMVILSVIAAPFMIMMDALPGPPGQNKFMNWLKGLIGNVIVFPATVILLLVSVAITAAVNKSGIGDGSFVGPLTGIGGAGIAQAVIGIGMLLSIPGLLDKIPGYIVPKGGGLGELGNFWQDPLKNNALSLRAAQYQKMEQEAKEKAIQKKMAERISQKYPSKGERPGDIDLAHSARANDLLTRSSPTLAANGFTRDDFLSQFGKAAPGEQQALIERLHSPMGPYNPDEVSQDLASMRALADYQAKWGEYARGLKAENDYKDSIRGRVDNIKNSLISRAASMPGAGAMGKAAEQAGGGGGK